MVNGAASRSTGPVRIRPGRSGPCDGEGAVAAGHGEVGEPWPPSGAGRGPASSPSRRGRRPARRDRPVGADQAGDEAVARAAARAGRCRAGSPRAPRRGSARGGRRRRSPARGWCAAIEARLGAAVGDLDPAVEREQMPPPGHRRIDQQPADPEPADVDVDIGQQRRIGIAGAKRGQPAAAAPPGCRASGCRYGCADRRRAGSRARRSARGRRRPCGSPSVTSCRVSSPKIEPSIRSTPTLSPETVSNALIWLTTKRRPGSVFSQSRKAPISSSDREQDDAGPFGDRHRRMAAADDDRLVGAASLAIRRPARSRRRR